MKTLDRIRQLINSDVADGKSYSEIARKIGVSKGNITFWLNDNVQPTMLSLQKISAAYNVSLSDLTGEGSQGDIDSLEIPLRYKKLLCDLENLSQNEREEILSIIEFHIKKSKSRGK